MFSCHVTLPFLLGHLPLSYSHTPSTLLLLSSFSPSSPSSYVITRSRHSYAISSLTLSFFHRWPLADLHPIITTEVCMTTFLPCFEEILPCPPPSGLHLVYAKSVVFYLVSFPIGFSLLCFSFFFHTAHSLFIFIVSTCHTSRLPVLTFSLYPNISCSSIDSFPPSRSTFHRSFILPFLFISVLGA